jgi:hypothetical protein
MEQQALLVAMELQVSLELQAQKAQLAYRVLKAPQVLQVFVEPQV